MKKYLIINFTWNDIMEKIREYIISNCKDYFEVYNSSYLTFYFQEIDSEKGLFVALFNDNSLCFESCLKNINIETIAYTEKRYKVFYMDDVNEDGRNEYFFKDLPILKVNEIRYIKLSFDNIKCLLVKILNILLRQELKYKCGFSKIIFNRKRDEYTFVATNEYEDLLLFDAQKDEEIYNVTNKIINQFI